MALVTLQRSPSPSNDPDEETAEGGDEGLDGRAALRHKSLSESYFTVKGAALILPHSEINRKTSRKNHGGEIQRHLQAMLYLLRPEDKIKVAIRLENQRESEHRYMALVSTIGRQDTEECVILGLDCSAPSCPSQTAAPNTPPSSPVLPDSHSHGATAGGEIEGRAMASASIGLVLPIWMGMKVRLSGDGGFSIITDEHSYLFKPVSVQAMWSAIQSVDKALHSANQMKYLAEGLTHTWVEYYRCKVDTSNQIRLATWNLMEDVEIFAPASLKLTNENETEKLKLLISAKLKEVMMSVDLDDATSRSLRQLVEEALNMKLDEFRNYFDEEMMRILGQMDAPSQILDFLYLGSEWNASNLDELQKIGIKYILNVTREIDNFFTGMFHYCNVRIYDYEDTELMKHWLKTYKFINKARKHDAKVLVHCKMGVSRSASTVIAYLMKENRWTLEKALAFVKERRSCVRPNKGFMEQLHTYEGILTASSKRDIFRSKSEHDIAGSTESGEGEENGGSQQETILGESVFRTITGEWASASLNMQEEILLQKDFSGEHGYTGMEPDFETDSRSADSMEESLPDIPSPLNKDAPVQSVVFSVQDSNGSAEPPTLYSSSSPPRVADLGLTSRIKPDTSWIRLAVGGESGTDNPNQEGMEIGESRVEEGQDTDDLQTARTQSLGSPDPPVIFIMGSEWDSDISVKTDVGENNQPLLACGAGDQAASSVRDLGVHHYYNREQIPWHPGKVRNIREELCKSGGQAGLPPTSGDMARPFAIESEKTLLEAVGSIKEAHAVPQSESCVELSALDRGATGMEIDDLSRSVYDLEDIPLVPGTVQRTRLEIEQRQKLYGDNSDQDISSIKRSASLREKREGSRSRHSQRRKTCTPIISPPPEKVADVLDVDMGTPVLRLDFEVGESTTDGVHVDLNRMEDISFQGSQKVPVYPYYTDCVPIKLGIVQRHKREIESKAEEGKQCLSADIASSGCSVEEMEVLSLPAVPQDSKNLSQIPLQGLVHAIYIPPAKPPCCLAGPGKKVNSIDRKMDKDSEDCLGWGAKDSARKLDGEPAMPYQQSAGCIRNVSGEIPVVSGNRMDSPNPTKEMFRAAATSPRKPYGKSNIDAETLAMIREIGSAFVTSPPRGEEEDVGESTSLVKHLVKKIEKDSRHGRPERKIILVDSSSKQDRPDSRRHVQMERPHSSLFMPSPEFTANMTKHLEGSKHSLLPIGHSAVLPGQTVCVSRNIAVTADSRNVATAMLAASSRSGGGDRSHSEPPSVVKHLCGKFESQRAFPYCDDELSTEISYGFSPVQSLPATMTMSGTESHFVSSSVQDRGDSGHNSCCTPKWSFKSSSIEESACSLPICNVGGEDASLRSQNSRRTHSAEPVSLVISSWPRHGSASRIRSPCERETGQSVEGVGEGFEGAKLRRLQNRKQPLPRHQCPEQGERACPPAVHPSSL